MPGQAVTGFNEKVAVVVGMDSDIGRSVGLQLALQGAFVIAVTSMDAHDASLVALRELKELGTLAHLIAADVSDADGVESLFAQIGEIYGRVDMLVNVLTRGSGLSLRELSSEQWDESIDSNLRSMFLVIKAGLPLMAQRPAPAVVNLLRLAAASSTSHRGLTDAVCESALKGMTSNLAVELAPKVRVNGVLANAFALDAQADRRIAVDQIARVCVYLLSRDAGALSGEVVSVGR